MTASAPTAPPNASHGALETLKPTSLFGYGLGDFGCNLAFSLSTSFLLFYYTDVAGISAAAIGTMFLVVRLWDAFTDLFAGRLVDRTMTRWGKFRPFILFGAVPLLFLSVLTFGMPQSLWINESNSNAGPALLYAYLTYAVLGLLYSMVNIPYGSLASAMTQSVNERAKLVAARFFGSALAGVFLTWIIAPRISELQGKSAGFQKALKAAQEAKDTAKITELKAQVAQFQPDMQAVFTQTTLWFVVLGSLCFFGTFYFCREKVARATPRVTIAETWETLRHNKPLGILCLASLFYLIGLFAVPAASVYYARYILGDTGLTVQMSIMNAGVSLLATPFIPWIIRKIGKKNLFQYSGLLTLVGGLVLFFLPAGGVILAMIFLAVKGAGASFINTAMFGLEADTVEYGEWKSGKRSEGATYSIFSFTRKVTQALGGAAGAWLIGLAGYVANAPTQSDAAMTAIRASIGLVPAGCALIAMLIFWKYPLTDSRFAEIRNEVEARKASLDPVIVGEGKVVDNH